MEHFGVFKQNFNPSLSPDTLNGETLSMKSGKVRVVRNQERSGLIRSRARGAHEALGEVVVFLDAHCEVNLNWLVPLLAPIAVNNKTMIQILLSIGQCTKMTNILLEFGNGECCTRKCILT